jgi:integrase
MPGSPRPYKCKDGTTTYQARWRPPGDGRDSERRTKSFPSRREATRWIAQMDADHARGTLTDPRLAAHTLNAVTAEWRAAEFHHLKRKTKTGYDNILSKHIEPAFGDRKLSAITPAHIQTWVNKLAADHRLSTARNVYGVLARVMGFAVRRRYLAIDPTQSVRLPRSKHEHATHRKDQVIITPDEIRQLAHRMPTDGYKAAVYVAAYCGLRAGELWSLQRRHVDLLRRTVTVERAQTEDQGLVYDFPKSAAAHRTISIPKPVADLLEAHLAADPATANDPDALVFLTPTGHPVRQSNFYKRVFVPAARKTLPERAAAAERRKQADRAAAKKPPLTAHRLQMISPLRFHDLRHTCASLCLSQTPNLHLVKQRLGHEDIRTTINQYGHMVPNVDAALADALGALFDQPAADNVVPLRADQADG